MLKAENKINNLPHPTPQNLLQRKKEGGKYILLYFPVSPVIFGFMENLQTGRFLSREEHLA